MKGHDDLHGPDRLSLAVRPLILGVAGRSGSGNRGRTEASVREQYDATARPIADRFVLPSAAHATLTVDGCASLDWPVEQILRRLHDLRLI